MKRWIILQNWPIAALIVTMGLSAVFLAWSSFNLFNAATANLALIARYGAMALLDGGLVQFAQICFNACVSLMLFLMFKGCETEIIKRWRDLNGAAEKSDGTEHM